MRRSSQGRRNGLEIGNARGHRNRRAVARNGFQRGIERLCRLIPLLGTIGGKPFRIVGFAATAVPA